MKRLLPLAIALVLPVTAWSQSTLNFPRGFSAADLKSTGFAIVNPGPSNAQVTYTLYSSSGQVLATSSQTIPARGQFAKLGLGTSELFQQAAATGWVQAASTTTGLQGFWIGGDFASYADGAAAAESTADMVFPLVSGQTEINVANPNATPATVTFRLYGTNGVELAPASLQSISARGFLQSQASALFPSANMTQATHIRAACTGQCSGTSVLTNYLASPSWGVVNAVDASVPVTDTSFPHVISGVGSGGNYTTVIGVTNLAATSQNVTLTFTSVSGTVQSVTRALPGNGAIRDTAQNFFGFSAGFTDGWVRVAGTGSITGFAAYGESVQGGLAIIPVQAARLTTMFFAHIADLAPWSTGLALLNTGTTNATVEVYAMTPAGGLIGGADNVPTARFTLNANAKRAALLSDLIPQTLQRTSDGGFVFVRSSAPLYGIQLFFSRSLTILSNVAAGGVPSGITFTPPSASANPAAGTWTSLPLRSGAKIVYVSSSMGNDLNDGLTPETPKRTLIGGFSAIANGMGDHLYLRRGDTFAELLQWNKSGFSAEYPVVLGAYGTGARPVIDRGADFAMVVSSLSGPTVRHVAIVDIHFLAAQRDWRRPGFTPSGGTAGIQVASGVATVPQIVDGLLIEGCRFEFLGQGIALVGPSFDSIRNVRINRNVFADIYVQNGHTNGIFASNVTGLVIEENLIDGVQQTAIAAGVPNVEDSSLDHSAYIQSDSRDAVMRNNIIANAFDGGMMRPGGTYRNNLVIGGTIGSHHGYMFSASAPIITEGVIPSVVGNAFLRPSQFGIQMGNISSGLVERNLILSGTTTGGLGFNLIGQTNQTTPPQVGVHNLTLRGNFILGMEGLNSAGPAISNVTIEDNQFRSPGRIIYHTDHESGDFHYSANAYRSEGAANQWFRVNNTNYSLSGWTTFIGEPGPTTASFVNPATAPAIAGYGLGSESDFLAGARQQSRQNWDDRYGAGRVIEYLRQQLGLPPL